MLDMIKIDDYTEIMNMALKTTFPYVPFVIVIKYNAYCDFVFTICKPKWPK